MLVLNEWIFHDLSFDNGTAKFRETADFFEAFQNSDDKLALPAEPRWKHKAFRLMTMSDPRQRSISKVLHRILRDSDQTVLVKDDAPLKDPGSYHSVIPEKDVYLIIAYGAVGADLLVTTDIPLFEALVGLDGVNGAMRDDFLHEYLH